MNKLDACVGDLVEWYDHEKKIILCGCSGILISDNGISYITYGQHNYHKNTFCEMNYKNENISILPRKIK
jgi:hypothetical protein